MTPGMPPVVRIVNGRGSREARRGAGAVRGCSMVVTTWAPEDPVVEVDPSQVSADRYEPRRGERWCAPGPWLTRRAEVLPLDGALPA
ncbi:hypothetical protein Acsp06_04240 [Actinomycetospora sp. NBRC 106375]|nr:hypothetical protein Acsp06_04240 [Actinomycetospora sp. NBRC 106375]